MPQKYPDRHFAKTQKFGNNAMQNIVCCTNDTSWPNVSKITNATVNTSVLRTINCSSVNIHLSHISLLLSRSVHSTHLSTTN